MIVSYSTYLVIVCCIAAFAIMPTVITKLKHKKPKGFGSVSFLLVLILLPINWYTPTIITVKDCGQYSKEILIFPEPGYSMGRYNYIVNKTSSTLMLEYVVYGNVPSEEVPENFVIKPGETSLINIVHLDYIFEEIPTSVKLKGDGAVHTTLYCIES